MVETIRFRREVRIPGGPVYHAGDCASPDPHLLTPTLVQDYVRRGWAEPVKAVTQPPRDTMVTGAPLTKRR